MELLQPVAGRVEQARLPFYATRRMRTGLVRNVLVGNADGSPT
jgi:hypothetical protein